MSRSRPCRMPHASSPKPGYFPAGSPFLWLAACCLLLGAAACFAQSAVSSLRGSITDATGALIAGARVVLENRETGFVQTRLAGAKGEYQFQQIPSGRYSITVAAPGFAPQSKAAMLLVNQPATVNFSLSAEKISTVINVTAETAALNLVDASLGSAVDTSTIQALPIEGRNVPDLLSLQPGVLYLGAGNDQGHDSRSGASLGARSDQGNLTLDGVDNNDQVRGLAFTGVLRSTLDSVQEFRVATAGFNADTGRSSGAQLSLLTRGGSNQLHGSLYEYNRNSLFAANDWFNKQAELAAGQPNVPGKLIRNTYGAALGGPIKHDRLFFFATYEGQQTAESQQQTLIVPTASLRAGQLKYYHTGAGGNQQVETLTPQTIAAMDPNCGKNCPWGAGVDPNSLALFNQYPLPNSQAAGDGLNTAAFTWAAPDPSSLNTYIGKLDYVVSPRNWLFVRGNLQNDKSYAAPEFPGQPASSTDTDNSKGLAAGDTWNVSPNLTNSFHYGFTRQGYASRGIAQGQYADFYQISPLYAQTRTTIVDVPANNLIDDVTWIRGRHTLQAGANYRLIYDHRQSDALSYASGLMNSEALANAGIAGTGQSLDPAAFGLPAVDSAFSNSYNYATANLVGLLDEVTSPYNYRISANGTQASLMPAGSLLDREFKNNEFEFYLQDSWRPRPQLTVNIGLRQTLLQTPYEIHGQQVQPTTDLYDWFLTRGQQAALGNTEQPSLAFAPAGQARGLSPYWPMQKNNLAPRIAFAYAPQVESGFWHKLLGDPGKSSIRAGYGIYYDHFGQSVVSQFDEYGSVGLSQSIMNPVNVLTPDTSPRFTGLHDVPTEIVGTPAATLTYPALAPDDPFTTGFAIGHGIDGHMKTPYAHVVNFSVQRELPGKFIFEAAYLGRFGRHLLQELDLAQPLDLVDPKSGQDYFSAAAQLSKLGYAGATTVPAISFFENMFPDAAGGGNTATQNIYNQLWRYTLGNETAALYSLDILCTPGCGGKTGRFWSPQYSSLYTWASIGVSNYNGAQFKLRRMMSRGLQFDFSYTYAKSLDMGSDAERSMYATGTNVSGTAFGAILNAWDPRQNYAPSDFDVRHLVTANWVLDLPVGRGKALAGAASHTLDAFIGGWRLAGVTRWSSGLPFSAISGAGWGTNWDEKSGMVQTGPIQSGAYISSSGVPQAFADPTAALANMRAPYPGEAGQRNNFRGDGYFGVDGSLSKTWTRRDRDRLTLAWEVFNVTNSVRFDPNPLTSLQNTTTSGEFGVYGATLTRPRIQQLSLRYAF